ncbi:MAG TPA: hypothetical protein VL361_10310 [Candidatus Limnocylindrales bacterium]|nr:hypothetical protein [Candidatus Limnocylindrales bacterium]
MNPRPVTQSSTLLYRRFPTCNRSDSQRLSHTASPALRCLTRAFTLMEVMIACGIFFMATFAILALVSTTLRNARGLQRGDIDAGMAAAQVYEVLRTNRLEQGSMSGDFGDAHRDYSWEANWDIDYDSGATNSLLKVDIVVNRRGNRQPVDALSIRVFSPNARSGIGPNFR